MRVRSLLLTLVFLTLVAGSSFASFSGGKSDNTPPPSNPTMDSQDASAPRNEAQEIYAVAYEEIAKAKKDLADGKTKNAEKKFRRALERGERATALDAKYHEAWNLVGYAARKLGDYDKAFAAYDKCLAIKPDYAPALEYLGEAWLEKGDLAKAQAQLVLLERYNAGEDAKTLKGQIDAYVAKHPDAAPASTPAAPASTDSSGTASTGSGQ